MQAEQSVFATCYNLKIFLLLQDENTNDVTEMAADRNEEPFGATGGENIQAPFHQASGDGVESKIEPSTKSKKEAEPPIFPSSSSSERGEGRPCICNNFHFRTVGADSQAQCMFCGAISTSPHTNGTNSNKSTTNPVSTTTGKFYNLSQSYAVSLPSLPDTSLEDGGCSNSQHDVESLVTGLPRGEGKTPVHSKFKEYAFPFQI